MIHFPLSYIGLGFGYLLKLTTMSGLAFFAAIKADKDLPPLPGSPGFVGRTIFGGSVGGGVGSAGFSTTKLSALSALYLAVKSS